MQAGAGQDQDLSVGFTVRRRPENGLPLDLREDEAAALHGESSTIVRDPCQDGNPLDQGVRGAFGECCLILGLRVLVRNAEDLGQRVHVGSNPP